MSWCETDMQKYGETLNVMKFEVFILGGQRIDQKRNGGEGGEGLRKERIEIERKETKG